MGPPKPARNFASSTLPTAKKPTTPPTMASNARGRTRPRASLRIPSVMSPPSLQHHGSQHSEGKRQENGQDAKAIVHLRLNGAERLPQRAVVTLTQGHRRAAGREHVLRPP